MTLPEISMADLERDMRDRWRPDQDAVNRAVAAMLADPQHMVAVVPMYQPGKRHGWWEFGQEVRTVHGVVFVGLNDMERPAGAQLPDYSWCREQAAHLAQAALGERDGTTAHAVVEPDGTWVVFEDYGRERRT